MSDAPQESPAKSIFLNAAELAPGPDREAYLAAACGDDAALRGEVDDLLGHRAAVGDFLEHPAPGTPGTAPAAEGWGAATTLDLPVPPVRERPGTAVGPYKLLEQIGEGGMGVVFLAEQTRPVRRQVALKVIKAGMDTRQVVARFEAERQALAMMDHPNIAKVFDAGVTETGRPYFVMELVKGLPITRYCDERRLTPRDRLGLFVQVCQGVQHAHQKGVIHRDLKPSNVPVALYDGTPVPKVIDFGIAKATGPRLTERTMFTGFGDVIGTPQYMSPEQAELNQLDVDTRSDVYALGVLLYELLTGTTPLEHARATKGALVDVLRAIREEDPPRPSTRLSTAAGLPAVAASRGVEPRKLTGLVRGELDWIVMKALEKDRARRYETANGFARDVQRYLDYEPVQACPPSAVYRFRKFARRNRAALAAAVLTFVLLVAGITGTTIGMLRARTAQARAEALSGFLADAFGAANPSIAGGDRNVKVADVLDRAAAQLAEKLAGHPEAEIDARLTIAETYNALGLYALAVDNFRRARDLAQTTYGGDAEQALTAANGLAWAMIEKGDYAAAEPLAGHTLATAKRVLGTAHPITWRAADTYAFALANGWRVYNSPDWRAKFEQSLPLKYELVEWLRRAPAETEKRDAELAFALHGIAVVLQDLGGPERFAEAERLQREAMAIVARHPEMDGARIRSYFAATLMLRNELDEAKREFEEMVPDQRNRLGDTHKITLFTLALRAQLLLRIGEHDAAASLYEELIGRERAGVRVRPVVPPETMKARLLTGLAAARLGTHDPDAALHATGEAIDLAAPIPGPIPELQKAWRLHGLAHYRLRDWPSAIDATEKAMALLKGGNSFHWFVLAMAHWQLDHPAAARDWHAKAVDWMGQNPPPDAELRDLRAEADALILGPTTRPATRPATRRT